MLSAPPTPTVPGPPLLPLRAVVAVCDLLATLLFMGGGVVALAIYSQRTSQKIDHGCLDIADYTLLVRGLPEDATEEEVGVSRAHIAACTSTGSWGAARFKGKAAALHCGHLAAASQVFKLLQACARQSGQGPLSCSLSVPTPSPTGPRFLCR